MSNILANRLIKVLSYLILSASVLYIGFLLYEHWHEVINIIPSANGWFVLVISAIIYLLLFIVISYGWYMLVYVLGGNVNLKACLIVYGRSQIAKYLPGNVFHYMGRYLLSHEVGLSNGIITASMFMEAFLMIFASSGLAVIAVIVFGWGKEIISINHWIILFMLVILIPLGGFILFRSSPKIRKWLTEYGEINLTSLVHVAMLAFFIYIIFFASIGLMLKFLTLRFGYNDTLAVLVFIGAFSISWVIGFITPGAPGGVGVREAILVSILAPFMHEAQALTLALAFRLVTILGDVLFFLVTCSLSVPWRKKLSGNG